MDRSNRYPLVKVEEPKAQNLMLDDFLDDLSQNSSSSEEFMGVIASSPLILRQNSASSSSSSEDYQPVN